MVNEELQCNVNCRGIGCDKKKDCYNRVKMFTSDACEFSMDNVCGSDEHKYFMEKPNG